MCNLYGKCRAFLNKTWTHQVDVKPCGSKIANL